MCLLVVLGPWLGWPKKVDGITLPLLKEDCGFFSLFMKGLSWDWCCWFFWHFVPLFLVLWHTIIHSPYNGSWFSLFYKSLPVVFHPNSSHHWLSEIHFYTYPSKTSSPYVFGICINFDWFAYCCCHGQNDTFIIIKEIKTGKAYTYHGCIDLCLLRDQISWPSPDSKVMIENHPWVLLVDLDSILFNIKFYREETIPNI